MKMSTRTVENPKVVSREEWLVARKKLLAKEKQLTRQRDAIAAERRQLPWVKVEKNYVFDSPSGKTTLADLFDGRGQLIVYHFRNIRARPPVSIFGSYAPDDDGIRDLRLLSPGRSR